MSILTIFGLAIVIITAGSLLLFWYLAAHSTYDPFEKSWDDDEEDTQ